MAASAWNTAPALALDFLGDERLARLAARGDQRAFGALYERYLPALTRYCTSILRHGADAEDAAQNSMVSALRALEGGTVPMRVKPWLYKIAHNEAISLMRTRKPSEELNEALLPTVGGGEEASAVRERLGQLMADLQSLTERQRQALVLRELYDFSYAEIAQTLGSSEAAAQQTVFEARSALQQFGEGRALDCEGVQRAMSACDGMRLRTRKVRAHVRGCVCCESFEASLLARRRDLGLLFPPAGAASGIVAALARMFGGGGGESLLAGLGLKGAAVGLALLAGGGAVVVTSVAGKDGPAAPVVAPASNASAPGAASALSSARGSGSGAVHPGGRGGKQGTGAKPGGKGKGNGAARPGGAQASAPGATSAGESAAPGGGVGQLADQPSGGRGSSGSGSGSVPGKFPGGAGAPSPVAEVVDGVGDAVAGVTGTVGGTVESTVDAVTDTAGAVGDAVGGATQGVNEAVEDVTGGATDAVGGAVPKLP